MMRGASSCSRPRALAAVVTWVVLLGAACSGGDDASPTATAEATATATASTTASRTPTATATLAAFPLVGPIEDGFVRRELAPDERPTEPHGIVFVDLASQTAEL